jgi:phospho-N-acetylmuramoyl-pentapeptide-transferase
MSNISSFLIAALLTIIIAPCIIPILRKLRVGQTIRSDGPRAHLSKAGTPTMGGIILLLPIAFAALYAAGITPEVVLLLAALSGFGLIGFADDFLKIVFKRPLGLKARWKVIGQVLLSLLIAFFAVMFFDRGTGVWFPFAGELTLGWLYLPFAIFVIVGTTNAVNLTDGLDGLAAGTVAIAAISFTLVNMQLGNNQIAAFTAALAGGCVGFLVYNYHPARVFMGDTGSLSLGGALAATAVLSKTELLLLIIGGVFVIETLSVIIQVIAFRSTGKRLFLMSPIHHHFELKGWRERKVVSVFYAIAVLFAAIGIILVN